MTVHAATPSSPQTAPTMPMVLLTVPTDIGKLPPKLGMVAILPDHTSDDAVFLSAHDGHNLALVPADHERVGDTDAAGLHASWLDPALALTNRGDGRTLRLHKGTPQTLFGTGLNWVDDSEPTWRPVPDGGTFPPVLDVFPRMNEMTDAAWTCLRVRVSSLAKLAAALNDAECDDRDSITLFVKENAQGDVQGAIIAVGNRGIGLTMALQPVAEASRKFYRGMLRRFGTGRTLTGKVKITPKEAMNPTPPDAAQTVPSYATGDKGEQIDTATGEVLTPEKAEQAAQVLNATGKAPAPLSPTDASVAAIGAVVGVGPAVADDGRDAPSSTWDNRLTVAPHVATKKINPQCGDMLRQAGLAQLNDVQSVRVVYADWRERIRAEVLEKTGYKLTDRQLDGLDEAIEARLSNKGQ